MPVRLVDYDDHDDHDDVLYEQDHRLTDQERRQRREHLTRVLGGDTMTFHPEEILAVLARHRVEYILMGGYAAQLHGYTLPTTDVDVTPEMSAENLQRLVRALEEMHAKIRVEGEP